MTEVDELRPVPREQAILESFFAQLGMFSFDRAKDYVEREKDASSRGAAGAIWSSLLAALAHLAAAEKVYNNLTYLGQKMGNWLTLTSHCSPVTVKKMLQINYI